MSCLVGYELDGIVFVGRLLFICAKCCLFGFLRVEVYGW